MELSRRNSNKGTIGKPRVFKVRHIGFSGVLRMIEMVGGYIRRRRETFTTRGGTRATILGNSADHARRDHRNHHGTPGCVVHRHWRWRAEAEGIKTPAQRERLAGMEGVIVELGGKTPARPVIRGDNAGPWFRISMFFLVAVHGLI